ncbi:MAG: hypothetical protein U0441_30305 [Polyangiaceae bacterium]
MQRSPFLPVVLFFTAAFGVFTFGACGGNVVLDGNTGVGGAGASAGAAGTNGSGGNTVNPSGGSTGDAGSVGVGGATIEPSCPPGWELCGDICVDLTTNPNYCGSCFNPCGGGESCVDGICQSPSCVTCAEYITNGGTLCDGLSQKIYDSLINCVCAGKCIAQCSDNVCTGNNVTADCQNCVLDTANGCGNEFNECSNDL